MIEPSQPSEYRIDPAFVEKLMNDIETAHAKAGTRPHVSRERQLASIMEALAPIDAFKLLVENADAIEKFPQHRFTTSDGRTFGVFYDGTRILGLLELEGVCINHRDKAGLERVKKVAGFIAKLVVKIHPLFLAKTPNSQWPGNNSMFSMACP
jgi:hypothetical protein